MPDYKGRGIVIPAGGRYTLNALVNITMLRKLGCELPIEVWYIGEGERHELLFSKLEVLGVDLIDALVFQEVNEIKHSSLHGWELKSFACKWSKFAEVIVMDADVLPVKALEYIFECEAYKDTGLLLLMDQFWHGREATHWKIIGIPGRHEVQVESGVYVVDKVRNYDWVWLNCKMNEYGALGLWSLLKIYGDKDTLAITAYLLNKPFTWSIKMMEKNILHTMAQYDWSCSDNPTFYHRVARKMHWQDNPFIEGFPFEVDLHKMVKDWQNEAIPQGAPYCCRAEYHIVKDKDTNERHLIELNNGEIKGAGKSERFYSVTEDKQELRIYDEECQLTASLNRTTVGWLGRWVVDPKYTVMVLI